jgi:AraC-like DNA-binding protein
MNRKKKPKMEYRYYEMPEGTPVLALLGERWIQNYGRDIDYLHFHNHLEIGYCYYGKGILTLEEEDIEFSGKTFSVIPKNYPHTTNSAGMTCSAWEYLFIDVDSFVKAVYYNNPYLADKIIRRVNRKAHYCKEEDNPEIAAYIRQIIEIMRARREWYQEEVKGVVLSLIVAIARWNKGGKTEGQEIKDSSMAVISQALDYISENYGQPLKVEDLAELCCISETHFRRVFTECMKTTPVEYVNRIRIKQACDELRKTNDSISAIAIKSGFTTLSTFNRNFKNVMGISPKEWRKDPEHYERKLLEYKIETNEGW